MSEKIDIACLAHKLGIQHATLNSKEVRKTLGQFMTPEGIAAYMAKQTLKEFRGETLRVLEPAAGSGILVAALLDCVFLEARKIRKIELVMYEVDHDLVLKLKHLVAKMRAAAKQLEIEFSCSIREQDFLLNTPSESFDIVISNPPFFKLKKGDSRSLAHQDVVHGQPNIYGLFMASCASLLAESGIFCFLTPRSWTSGPYFANVRKHLLKHLSLDAIHLFTDRRAAFKEDRIQQEMMITWATAGKTHARDVLLMSSEGAHDVKAAKRRLVKNDQILSNLAGTSIVIPATSTPRTFSQWTENLTSLGLKASTGKVVPFRAQNWIVNKKAQNTAPLFWLQHVNRASITWPLRVAQEHIKNLIKSKKLLVPNENYVFVRRFSPRDSLHWVTAAPYLRTVVTSHIGIENHLNYIKKIDGELSRLEAVGIAAYLNSKLVNEYFLEHLGHTQINVSDLNQLPFPEMAKILRLGEAISSLNSTQNSDQVTSQILEAPASTNCSEHRDHRHEQSVTEESSV